MINWIVTTQSGHVVTEHRYYIGAVVSALLRGHCYIVRL